MNYEQHLGRTATALEARSAGQNRTAAGPGAIRAKVGV